MAWDGPPAPYRIETERLVLRCWEPSDAPLLKDALDSSLDHLRPFMDWAHAEPEPVEAKAERLRTFRAPFDTGVGQLRHGHLTPIDESEESGASGASGLHPARRAGRAPRSATGCVCEQA